MLYHAYTNINEELEMKRYYFLNLLFLASTLLWADGPVLKTGQTVVVKTGDDGTYQTGINRSYSTSNGIVTDHATGLQWQDDYSDNGGSIKTANWINAQIYCENLALDGGGWKLPSSRELMSIIDKTRTYPSIDISKFNAANVKSHFYWTSTVDIHRADSAWIVSFGIGDSYFQATSNSYSVRCVRNIP